MIFPYCRVIIDQVCQDGGVLCLGGLKYTNLNHQLRINCSANWILEPSTNIVSKCAGCPGNVVDVLEWPFKALSEAQRGKGRNI